VTRVVALLIAGGVTLAILLFAPQIQKFQQYGYPGIFLTSLIGNASIALPIPSLAITFAMGGVLNWVIVGLVSGIGEALGESTGYLAGFAGSAIIENRSLYQRMQYWMENHGMLTIFVLSAVPNPLFDLAGIAAGASRYSYLKFLLAAWIGKTIKTLIFAWAGAHSITWLLQFL
jgi:membrane protein DedA with SNARE-associated domain